MHAYEGQKEREEEEECLSKLPARSGLKMSTLPFTNLIRFYPSRNYDKANVDYYLLHEVYACVIVGGYITYDTLVLSISALFQNCLWCIGWQL